MSERVSMLVFDGRMYAARRALDRLYEQPPAGTVIGIDRGYDETMERRDMAINSLLGSEKE